MKKTIAAAALFVLAVAQAEAQGIQPVEFEGQPLMNAPGGIVSGCGIRFTATQPYKVGDTYNGNLVDGSINLFRPGFGAVKAGWEIVKPAAKGLSKEASGSALSWVRVDGQQPLAAKDGKDVPSENPGYRMYSADMERSTDSLIGIMEGRNLRVAFTMESGSVAIFSGKVSLGDADREQFIACIGQLASDATPGK